MMSFAPPARVFSPRLKLAVAALLVVAVTAGLYGQGYGYPFESDDPQYLGHNPAVRSLNLHDVFFTGLVQTRPLVQLSLALNYHFHQMRVQGFHLVNIALQALMAALFMLLAALIFRRRRVARALPAALLAGLLAAVHPVLLESVTLIGTRDNIQAAIFMILCLLVYLRSQGITVLEDRAPGPGWRQGLLLAGSVLLGALAVLSKENAVVLPALVVLADYFLLDRPAHGLRFRLAVFALYFAALGGLEAALLKFVGYTHPMIIGYRVIPLAHFLDTQLWVLPVYLGLIAFPLHLTLEPMVRFQTSLFQLRPLLGGLILLAVLTAALVLARKKNLWAFAGLWFFISISATSSIVPFVEFMAVRFLYVPVLGFLIAFAAWATAPRSSRTAQAAALAGAVLVPLCLAALSAHRLPEFRNPVALYRYEIRQAPQLSRPFEMLADRLFAQGRAAEAIPYAYRALSAPEQNFLKHRVRALLDELYQSDDPFHGRPVTDQSLERVLRDHPRAFLPLARAYQARGDLDRARQYFEASIQTRRENNPLAYLGLSSILEQSGDLTAALQWLRLGMEASPNADPQTRDLLRLRRRQLEPKAPIPDLAAEPPFPAGILPQLQTVWQIQAQGRLDDALSLLQQVELSVPNHPVPPYLRAVILLKLGRTEAALAAFRQAITMNPPYAPAFSDLALALLAEQKTPDAEKVFQEALARGVRDPFIYFNLGSLLAEAGRFREALAIYQKGLQIQPDHPLLKSGAEVMAGYLEEFY